ncbi:MAG: TIR domain-containing protein [Lachnospiraceae bacterium]
MKQKTVFVSYSSKDKILVNKIIDMIEDMGISCWKAPECIPAGSSYAREIPKAIANCRVFLLMLSSTSQDSIWVEKEIDNAITHRKTIIPLALDDEPLNDAFLFYLNNVQMVSYYHNPERAIESLKNQLNALLDEEDEQSGRGNEKKAHNKPTAKLERKMSISPAAGSVVSNKEKSNALRVNRVPVECQYCGCKHLDPVGLGRYCCENCGKENYDDFQTIRNYLDKVGSASALEIERVTGVPRNVVKHFFREEYLEISGNSIGVPCESCGAPIRTGIYCERCKKEKASEGNTTKLSSMRGSWYT